MVVAAPLEVFYAYAEADETLRLTLEKHLGALQTGGLITSWYERLIKPGSKRDQEIITHLERASIILLLITPDFLSSDYCYSVEMQRALERHAAGLARVIPILLRPVYWGETPFTYLPYLPRNGRAVTSWLNQDEAFTEIAEGIRTVIAEFPGPVARSHIPPLPSRVSRQNRERLLKRVRSFWIEGVLNQSLHHTTLLTLQLNEQPEAVANPWKLVLQEANLPSQPLPAGTRISQVYDHADGELLILGDPGIGKTTLLLELTRDLLVRAENDSSHPIPVFFNLSSWAEKRQPLTLWLVEELRTKYQVPHKVAQEWVDANQLVLLLDGLDEVTPEFYSACINAINAYRQEHGIVSVVVSSRYAEYQEQTAQVVLHTAVVVQPLTAQQIDAYLSSASGQLEGVRVALAHDRELQELATTPLMLNILMLAYQGQSVESPTTPISSEEWRQLVFEQYVKRMFSRREGKSPYTLEETKHWLTWLAQQLTKRNQTQFYLEQMQPDWLEERRFTRSYERLAVRLPGILIGILASFAAFSIFLASFTNITSGISILLTGGLIGGLFSNAGRIRSRVDEQKGVWRNLWHRFTIGLRSGAFIGLAMGLSFGFQLGPHYTMKQWLTDGLTTGLSLGVGCLLLCLLFQVGKRATTQTETPARLWGKMWSRFFNNVHARNSLLVGVCLGVGVGIVGVKLDPRGTPPASNMAFNIVIEGLIGFLVSVLLVERKSTIQPTEMIVWSWPSLWRSLTKGQNFKNGLLIAALFGISFGLSYGISIGLIGGISAGFTYTIGVGLGYGLSAGLSYWLLIGLFHGLYSDALDAHHRIRPNQGIRNSLRNSIVIGFISACVGCLLCILNSVIITALWLGVNLLFNIPAILKIGLSSEMDFLGGNWLIAALSNGLQDGLAVAISGGLLVALISGGLACFRHVILRWFLWRTQSIPWKYVRFLDFTTKRVLLRRVGGGYIFTHRLLLDYFATQDQPPTSQETTGPLAVADQPPFQLQTVPAPIASSNRTLFSRTSPRVRILLLGIILLFIILSITGLWGYQAYQTRTNPYPAYVPDSTVLIMNDPLNQPGQWIPGTNPNMGGSCQFSNGAYVIHQPKLLGGPFNCFSTSTPFSNFIFEVRMTITQGDCGGISFRADASESKFYYFVLCQNGLYNLTKFNGFGIPGQFLIASSITSLIHPGLNQSNLIAIVAQGDTITLYANRHDLATVRNTGYTSGGIALTADELVSPTTVAYNDAKLWMRPNDLAHDHATASAIAQMQEKINPYPAYVPDGTTLVMNDPLNQPERWAQFSNADWGGSCQFSKEAYVIQQTKVNRNFTCFPATPISFSNFIFEVHMTITQGDCGGIVFRTDITGGKSYVFRVCQNGQYGLIKYTGTGIPGLPLSVGSTLLIHQGANQSNVVAVVAQGSTMMLYVNRHELASVQDTSYTSGGIALTAGSNTSPTEVAYSNARLWMRQNDVLHAYATATAIAQMQAKINPYPAYVPDDTALIINDPLNQPGLWMAGLNADWGGSCQFNNGAYIIRQVKNDRHFNCFSTTSTTFSNFVFEVHMTIAQGDCGGMSFRADASESKTYYLNICQSGQYGLAKFTGVGIPGIPLAGGTTSLIHQGLNQSNLIAIVARGSTITLYANRHELVTVQDTSYTSGKIAIAAGDVTHPTEVVYSNVRVWTF
jgi:hypothetical protein